MTIEIIHQHYLHTDAGDSKLFAQIINGISRIEKELQEVTEKMNKIMKKQDEIDALTAQIEGNTAGVKEAIVAESAEIQEAINSANVDTTKLEAAIAANSEIRTLVEGIFTPTVNTSEETKTEETPENGSDVSA